MTVILAGSASFVLCRCQKMSGNHPREFKKRSLPIISAYNEPLSVVAVRVCNPDCSTGRINGSDDHARAHQRQKRGAGASKIDLDEAALISSEQTGAILDLNDALERLAMLDSRTAHVVELRFFGGLNQDEMAEVLKISPVTVRRDWVFARAWLFKELHNPA